MTKTELEALLDSNYPNAWVMSPTPIVDSRSPLWGGRTGAEQVQKFEVGLFDVSAEGEFEESYIIALHQGADDTTGWAINIPIDGAGGKQKSDLDWLGKSARDWDQLLKVSYSRKFRVASIMVMTGDVISYHLVKFQGGKTVHPATQFHQL